MSQKTKKGILERLAAGPVIGDGSMCMTLEKRGYCRAGPWTPEAVVTYPDAVRQLLREYQRAGADVLQTPCFYSSDKVLNVMTVDGNESKISAKEINEAACRLAHEVASEGDALVCGSFTTVPSFRAGDKGCVAASIAEFEAQMSTFEMHNVDFVLGEFFGYVEEAEIFVEVVKKMNLPIACTMRIGQLGDFAGVSLEECALRLARTGADIIGVNCYFDVNSTLKTMKRIKAALDGANLKPHLMCQPVGWLCPEVENNHRGLHSLPESPLALDPRIMTRFEAHQFARSAYELGVNYIGGCCGTESHHIRAFAQELAAERNCTPPVNDMCPPYFGFLNLNNWDHILAKANKEYWQKLKSGSGRPFNSALSAPDVVKARWSADRKFDDKK